MNATMTIEQVRSAKARCEKAILEAVMEFKNGTGCCPLAIELSTLKTQPCGGREETFVAGVKVRLAPIE